MFHVRRRGNLSNIRAVNFGQNTTNLHDSASLNIHAQKDSRGAPSKLLRHLTVWVRIFFRKKTHNRKHMWKWNIIFMNWTICLIFPPQSSFSWYPYISFYFSLINGHISNTQDNQLPAGLMAQFIEHWIGISRKYPEVEYYIKYHINAWLRKKDWIL